MNICCECGVICVCVCMHEHEHEPIWMSLNIFPGTRFPETNKTKLRNKELNNISPHIPWKMGRKKNTWKKVLLFVIRHERRKHIKSKNWIKKKITPTSLNYYNSGHFWCTHSCFVFVWVSFFFYFAWFSSVNAFDRINSNIPEIPKMEILFNCDEIIKKNLPTFSTSNSLYWWTQMKSKTTENKRSKSST